MFGRLVLYSLNSARAGFFVQDMSILTSLCMSAHMSMHMCVGRFLFVQDTSDNEIVNTKDRTRLCRWNCIGDDVCALARVCTCQVHICLYVCVKELSEIFSREGNLCSIQQRQDARHLVRWCLQGDPSLRPTVPALHIFVHIFVCLASPTNSGVLRCACVYTTVCTLTCIASFEHACVCTCATHV